MEDRARSASPPVRIPNRGHGGLLRRREARTLEESRSSDGGYVRRSRRQAWRYSSALGHALATCTQTRRAVTRTRAPCGDPSVADKDAVCDFEYEIRVGVTGLAPAEAIGDTPVSIRVNGVKCGDTFNLVDASGQDTVQDQGRGRIGLRRQQH